MYWGDLNDIGDGADKRGGETSPPRGGRYLKYVPGCIKLFLFLLARCFLTCCLESCRHT